MAKGNRENTERIIKREVMTGADGRQQQRLEYSGQYGHGVAVFPIELGLSENDFEELSDYGLDDDSWFVDLSNPLGPTILEQSDATIESWIPRFANATEMDVDYFSMREDCPKIKIPPITFTDKLMTSSLSVIEKYRSVLSDGAFFLLRDKTLVSPTDDHLERINGKWKKTHMDGLHYTFDVLIFAVRILDLPASVFTWDVAIQLREQILMITYQNRLIRFGEDGVKSLLMNDIIDTWDDKFVDNKGRLRESADMDSAILDENPGGNAEEFKKRLDEIVWKIFNKELTFNHLDTKEIIASMK